MTALTMLWLPIVVSSVIVFIASSIIHMGPFWHKNDFPKMAKEDEVRAALGPLAIPPGEYMVPRCNSQADMKSPEFIEKLKKGPVVMMTVLPNQTFSMGKPLVLWLLYVMVIGLFSGYIAGRALPVGTHYLQVFRFVGSAAFMGYAMAHCQASIWMGRSWCSTLKNIFDGLIYALLTAGAFGWLWPR